MQTLMLALMGLKHFVSATFLSHSFKESTASAPRVFIDAINIMFIPMKPLVMWPESEGLEKNIPMKFRKHLGLLLLIFFFLDF